MWVAIDQRGDKPLFRLSTHTPTAYSCVNIHYLYLENTWVTTSQVCPSNEFVAISGVSKNGYGGNPMGLSLLWLVMTYTASWLLAILRHSTG